MIWWQLLIALALIVLISFLLGRRYGISELRLDDETYEGKVNRFYNLLIEIANLRDAKWNDYGGSFADLYREYGYHYIVPRLTEKVKRLESLTISKKKQMVKEENIEDTMMDVAIICLNTIVENRGGNDG